MASSANALSHRLALTAAISAALLAISPASHSQAVVDAASLPPARGFVMHGANASDSAGSSVAPGGDFNGDGIDDLLVGAVGRGEAYVIFGTRNFPSQLDLATLDGNNGVAFFNSLQVGIGQVVAGAGDINGDGIDDVMLGTPSANSNIGRAFVVFGSDQNLPATINVNNALDGTDGFSVEGYAGQFGFASSGAGDFNGDGFDDLMISAPTERVRRRDGTTIYEYESAGKTYLLFGSDQGFPSSFDVTDIDGSNGLSILGVAQNDFSGISVGGVGDFNGDGFDDIVIGSRADRGYVVFGRANSGVRALRLSNLDGSNGFRVDTAAVGDAFDFTVSGAGDVNGDGMADVLVGAARVDFGSATTGASYVVYGDDQTIPAVLNVSSLNGSNGFAIRGIDDLDFMGERVAGPGDVNGDGIDDLFLGATGVGPMNHGESYLIMGDPAGFAALFSVDFLDGQDGVTIPNPTDYGYALSSAVGDVNGDGLADVVIGDEDATPNGASSGSAYVVFGNAAPTVSSSRRVLGGPEDGSTIPQVEVAALATLSTDRDPLQGMAIVGVSQVPGAGIWQYRAAGNVWTDVPFDVGDTRAVVVGTQSACRFVAAPGFKGESAPLTVRLWDGFLGQTGTSENIVRAIGGFGGFSSDENLLELVADVSNELFQDSFE